MPSTKNTCYDGEGPLPRLHYNCFAGDMEGVRQCLREGDDVHHAVDLLNQNQQLVVGVTPLYLAAQQGHKAICELLLQNGADILRQCAIPATGEVFGATDIAMVHFHLTTFLYLRSKRNTRLAKMSAAAARRGRALNLHEPLVDHCTV